MAKEEETTLSITAFSSIWLLLWQREQKEMILNGQKGLWVNAKKAVLASEDRGIKLSS